MERKTYNYYGEEKHLYKNQDFIRVMKDDKDSGRGYLSIDNATLFQAKRTLSNEAFAVYLYLASNANGFPMGWSPKDACKVLGMNIKTARKGYLQLKETRYIVHNGTYDNDFEFHRSPVVDGEKDNPIVFDKLMAQQAVMASNKRIKKRLTYAKTEEDYKAIDADTDRIVRMEFPEVVEDVKPITAEPDKPENISFLVKMGRVLEENPDLRFRYHGAKTPEEQTAVNNDIRTAVIAKYGAI